MPHGSNVLLSVKSNVALLRAIMSGKPNYMVMFATARCNARCPMCFYWKETERADVRSELQLHEYEKISRSLSCLHYLSIGGGEPFLRQDLPQIVEAFYKYSRTRVVTVATNGSLPDRVKKYINYLFGNCPGIQLRIQVSIDNLYEKHDENRGFKGLFEKMLETCKVIDVMKEAGAPLMFSVGTVMTPKNRSDLQELRSFLNKNITYDDLSLIYPRGNAKDPSYKDVTLAEYQEAKKAFESIHTDSGSFARLYQAIDREAKRGIESFLKAGPKGYPWACVAGERMITLTEKGLLTPCEMLYQLKPGLDSGLGNVRDWNYDIMRMLSSDKSRKLRTYIEQTHCSCSYECAALCNVVFQKKQWPKILKDVLMP
jgi:MoaA/NifB/PqqE/SkfB family radical SAM enzyme